MLLSIIVPVYNKESSIARCLESLQLIECEEIEVVIVNDGSTDRTRAICEKYLSLDSRFRLIDEENSGVSAARNLGIKECKGKYIAFVDADDEITKGYNELLEILKRKDYDLVGFSYCSKQEDTLSKINRPYLVSGENTKENLLNCFLTGESNSIWSNVYLSRIIQENGIWFTEKMSMGEDAEFNSLFFRYCDEIYYLDKACYIYHMDIGDSATHLRKLSYLNDLQRMYERYLEISHIDERLEFLFDYEFYLNFVCEIIQDNIGKISKEENRKFRKSKLFKAVTLQKCGRKKMELKRWYIKSNLYYFIRIKKI